MSTAFSNALAGLNANSQAIDVVSSNLANLNTTGYKDIAVSFQDLVNESLGGVSAAQTGGSVIMNSKAGFTQGSITSTGQPFDAAIQGSGFFILQSPSGEQVYSRAGNFTLDANGNLLSSNGDSVQGWTAVNGVLNTSGAVGNITIPESGLQAPVATQNFSLSSNLDAGAAVGSTDATFTSPIQVVDSLGQTHALTVTYTETAPGTWTYNVNIPSADIGAGTSGTTSIATGTLSFDSSGNLVSPPAGSGPVPISIPGLSDGAATLNLNWNLYNANGSANITSYNAASSNLAATQDGTRAGQLTSVSIGDNGVIEAQYSNGNSVNVGQIALASILNPQSMTPTEGNAYALTSATALPAIGLPNTGTRGTITGGALESSTVDIATEFTNLLTFERGYQSNSKVITTENDILQQTVALIQQ